VSDDELRRAVYKAAKDNIEAYTPHAEYGLTEYSLLVDRFIGALDEAGWRIVKYGEDRGRKYAEVMEPIIGEQSVVTWGNVEKVTIPSNSNDRAVDILKAKAAELEVMAGSCITVTEATQNLTRDLALIANLLAEHIRYG
jgi:hypothetical protein